MGFLTKIDMTNSTIRYLEFKEYWKTNVEKHLFRIAKETRFYLHIKNTLKERRKTLNTKKMPWQICFSPLGISFHGIIAIICHLRNLESDGL